MGKINMQKVLIGGLIAGLVLNVIDYVAFGVIWKAQMAANMQALGKAAIPNSMVPWFVVMDFIGGIFLVFLYAAVRPRFGGGPGTAVKSGLVAWFCGSFLVNAAMMWPMAIFPHNFIIQATILTLVAWPLATVIGAKFYTEGAAMGAGMGAGAGMGSRM
ncbi:MAG TPA: hypothetical protein VKQ05_14035 [Gemmatimonadales bacterium]|nr:hypothetical protein [Gemmatimonadales bacterium]